ncbi:unnamed protein product [Camellia sinensis]
MKKKERVLNITGGSNKQEKWEENGGRDSDIPATAQAINHKVPRRPPTHPLHSLEYQKNRSLWPQQIFPSVSPQSSFLLRTRSFLACLRSLIRKCVNENFTGDDILKLFPPDLPLDLQSTLILLFQKYQDQWKEEMSREQ